MVIERLIAGLLGIEWSFAGSNQRRMVGKRGRQVVDMLPFVRDLTMKSLYSPPSTLISVRRLKGSDKWHVGTI